MQMCKRNICSYLLDKYWQSNVSRFFMMKISEFKIVIETELDFQLAI